MEWPSANYTGEWVTFWPNGQQKYRAQYVDGKREGEVVCFWEDGSVAQRGIAIADECTGVWTDYRFGYKFKETDYKEQGNFVVRFFWPDGRILRKQVWENGCCVSDEPAQRGGLWSKLYELVLGRR